jgi:t-SNARE complex subunit (syntaxin)
MEELRQSLSRLEDRIRQLNQKQTGVLSQTIVNSDSKEDLEIAIDEIKQHVRSLRPRIRDIDLSIRQDEQSGRLTGAELRIRRNQCEQIKRRLHDVLSLFNDSQTDYKRRVSSELSNVLQLKATFKGALNANWI